MGQNIDDGSGLNVFDECGMVVLLFFAISADLFVAHTMCILKRLTIQIKIIIQDRITQSIYPSPTLLTSSALSISISLYS